MGRPADLLLEIRQALEAAAVPADAAPMQAYMKSAMPFWGVKAPARRAALRPLWKTWRFRERGALEEAARHVWLAATHREERYAVLDLLQRRPHLRLLDVASLPFLEALIVEGAWWDSVDDLAGKKVFAVWSADPAGTAPTLRAWARSDDLWLRRSAILAQLGAKDATDVALLEELMAPALTSEEFFLRKAIGWALRQYARTDPGWVRAYVEAHPELSGLSRREALKHLS
jgi:3-methyladenine DNA glycosylase AlkD